jgi:WD40 repeat protein
MAVKNKEKVPGVELTQNNNERGNMREAITFRSRYGFLALALAVICTTTLFVAPTRSTASSPKLRLLHSVKSPIAVNVLPAWNPKNNQLATGCNLDKRIVVWDSRSRKIVFTLDKEVAGVNALAYSPDGKYLAVGRGFVQPGKPHINVYDAATGKLLRNILPPTSLKTRGGNNVNALAFSTDSRLLAANGYGAGSIGVVYDIASGKVVAKLDPPTGQADVVTSLAYSPDGRWLAMGHLSGKLQLRDTGSWSIVGQSKAPVNARGLAFTPDSKSLAVGSGVPYKPNGSALPFGSDVHILESSSLALSRHFLAYGKTAVASLSYIANGRMLLAGGSPAKVIDAETGAVIKEINFTSTVHFPAMSTDGRKLAVASRKLIQFWELAQ